FRSTVRDGGDASARGCRGEDPVEVEVAARRHNQRQGWQVRQCPVAANADGRDCHRASARVVHHVVLAGGGNAHVAGAVVDRRDHSDGGLGSVAGNVDVCDRGADATALVPTDLDGGVASARGCRGEDPVKVEVAARRHNQRKGWKVRECPIAADRDGGNGHRAATRVVHHVVLAGGGNADVAASVVDRRGHSDGGLGSVAGNVDVCDRGADATALVPTDLDGGVASARGC